MVDWGNWWWLNFERRRRKMKIGATLLEVRGRPVLPVITPDDPERVAEVLSEHGVDVEPPLPPPLRGFLRPGSFRLEDACSRRPQ
jgi:hypothetical protein